MYKTYRPIQNKCRVNWGLFPEAKITCRVSLFPNKLKNESRGWGDETERKWESGGSILRRNFSRKVLSSFESKMWQNLHKLRSGVTNWVRDEVFVVRMPRNPLILVAVSKNLVHFVWIRLFDRLGSKFPKGIEKFEKKVEKIGNFFRVTKSFFSWLITDDFIPKSDPELCRNVR